VNNKEKAKEEIKLLVEKYNRLVEAGKVKSYNEEMTKKDFILPLFRALGWSVEDGEEVTAEEKISKGRVDYAFRIQSIPKLFLEAKSLKEDLDKIEFAEQAINYAWHKGATWAILTDFEGIKVFNAEWKSTNPLQNMFFSLGCNQFLERFEQLWLLSRESLESGVIDTEAEKWGKKAKKVTVDKQLLSDLTRFRELLTKNILKNNASKNLSAEELDEAIQRIIDRLIFIRTIEDKQLEAPILQSLVREDQTKRIYKKLNNAFRKIDDIYNSKLFAFHLCEELNIDDDVLEKIITGLFKTSDETVHYDFSAIEADVLGNIYEQYLGYLLKKTEKRGKLVEGKAHRKEQGIYYTPTYVVDYIVKNTIGELAKDKKVDLSKIKVLDPACGSGSFLMKAFDYLVTLDRKKNGITEQTKLDTSGVSATYGRKIEILKNNIFGVDLDPKAVEIAQLNLLLKAAEKKHRLPTLEENIKVGNSLIDDFTVSSRAFKWEEQFKEIISSGGFDVVVGNPPYFNLQTIKNKNENTFFEKQYSSFRGKADILYLFIEKSNKLLKEDGYLGFIVANYFLRSHYADKLREFISKNYKIVKIADFGSIKIFQDANVDTSIIIMQKCSDYSHRNKFSYGLLLNENSITNYLEDMYRGKEVNNSNYKITINKQVNKGGSPWKFEAEKIAETVHLSTICDLGKGAATGNDDIFVIKGVLARKLNLEKELLDLVVDDSSIDRYKFNISDSVLIKTKRGTDISNFPNIKRYLESKKDELKKRYAVQKEGLNWFEIVRYNDDIFGTNVKEQIYAYYRSTHNKFAYSEKRLVTLTTTFVLTLKEQSNINLKYLLALLNSNFIEYYSRKNAKKMGKCFEYSSNFIGSIPVKIISESQQQPIIKLVDRMLSLNKRLNELKDKSTDEKARIEAEIKKTDQEIDELVYELYGITKEEKNIIEESLR